MHTYRIRNVLGSSARCGVFAAVYCCFLTWCKPSGSLAWCALMALSVTRMRTYDAVTATLISCAYSPATSFAVPAASRADARRRLPFPLASYNIGVVHPTDRSPRHCAARGGHAHASGLVTRHLLVHNAAAGLAWRFWFCLCHGKPLCDMIGSW